MYNFAYKVGKIIKNPTIKKLIPKQGIPIFYIKMMRKGTFYDLESLICFHLNVNMQCLSNESHY